MAPNRLPWSVSATAGMPSCAARSKSGSSLIAPSRSEYWLCRWRWTKGVAGKPLLPLDGSGGLGGDVVDDPVDALHLVDDPARDRGQHLRGDARPIGGHGVHRGDAAHSH